jgi:hypothetical protein
MWEIWENPNRDVARINQMQDYLSSGFFHVVFNEPPLGALDHLQGVSRDEYDQHCLRVAKERLSKLIQ